MPSTVAVRNRQIRQEALREQLSAQGHVQHVVDIAKKLSKDGIDLPPIEIQAKKHAADIHLKLINKYLPDLKGIEIEGQIDSELTITRKEYKPST